MQIAHILPLVGAMLYSFSALCTKQALIEGYGIMRMTFITNIALAICFMPLLLVDHQIADIHHLWAPILAGTSHFITMSLIFVTIRSGDISVQTPIMGSKILFVTTLTILLYKEPIPLPWWIAAGLAVIAIACLGKTNGTSQSNRKVVIKTILLTLASSAISATTDLIVSEEAYYFGKTTFLVVMMSTTALLSFSFIPFFRGGLLDASLSAWKWAGGGILIGVCIQILFFLTIALYENPTTTNILYSSRGIWSILIVWSIGHWFRSTEQHIAPKILRLRLVGALLLFIAIIIVLSTEKAPVPQEQSSFLQQFNYHSHS